MCRAFRWELTPNRLKPFEGFIAILIGSKLNLTLSYNRGDHRKKKMKQGESHIIIIDHMKNLHSPKYTSLQILAKHPLKQDHVTTSEIGLRLS